MSRVLAGHRCRRFADRASDEEHLGVDKLDKSNIALNTGRGVTVKKRLVAPSIQRQNVMHMSVDELEM